MRTMTALISRNRKLFFRDRGMFLSSLITPVILIVLYATFLANDIKIPFCLHCRILYRFLTN